MSMAEAPGIDMPMAENVHQAYKEMSQRREVAQQHIYRLTRELEEQQTLFDMCDRAIARFSETYPVDPSPSPATRPIFDHPQA